MTHAEDWCAGHLGQSVVADGAEGTLSGYSSSDGIWWATVEFTDGTTKEWPADDVRHNAW